MTDRLRVASIPAAHPYVRHLALPGGDPRVVRLPDPRPDVPHPSPGQWWPPRMLDPGWIENHRDDFDLVHLHFGFDAVTDQQLRAWLTGLRKYGKPLVFTVHDLVNPHFADQAAHRAHLDRLIPAADALVTLTQAAADQITQTWARQVTVLPHPHIVPLASIGSLTTIGSPTGRVADRFVIGVHAKNLRANLDPVPVLRALLRGVADRPAALVQLTVHPEVLADPAPRARELRGWLARHGDDPQLQVLVRPRLSDDELWRYLAGLDLAVLPYRFGTHSGWLEACTDLGVPVLVPRTGCFADQHGHPSFDWPDTGGESLATAVAGIVDDRNIARRTVADRRAQRVAIAAGQLTVYKQGQSGYSPPTDPDPGR